MFIYLFSYFTSMEDLKKNGYIAGAVSSVISIVFIVFVINTGLNLSGQIMLIFGLFFGSLSIGSFLRPDSIGQVTSQILENIAKNTQEQNRRSYKKRQKVTQVINNYGTMSNAVGSNNTLNTKSIKK